MQFPPNRLVRLLALLMLPLCGARAVNSNMEPPEFLSGTSGGFPDYTNDFRTLPVGKTIVVPIVVSGSGPMTYSATSTSASLLPLIKTGYPVMNIAVSYSGTTTLSGSLATLYSFANGTDGGHPRAPLAALNSTTFVGATLTGGTNGFGTIFSVTTSGGFDTVYPFTGGTDGGLPNGPLFLNSGNFYGTTGTGGASGLGTVYQLTTSGSLTTLHAFTGSPPDGATPLAGVVTGSDGNFYGTTTSGGADGFGTVFRLILPTTGTAATSGSFSTIYSFTSGTDGSDPQATLVAGTDGELYGTTVAGGASGHGTVFRITLTGSLDVLYSFTGGDDGGSPMSGVTFGDDGNLYGTTVAGGSNSFGTVYQLQLAGSGSLNTIHAFASGADGASPFAGLALGTDGNFYGAAEAGGTANFGTLYQVNTTGSGLAYTTLFTFTSGADGANPFAGLVQGSDGNFYGLTETDGTGSAGTVYQLGATFTAPFTGSMTFALLRDMTPVACGYVAGFAQSGYYNGTPDHPLEFFRITNLAGSSSSTPGFIAQAGGPTNSGTDSPGFTFDNEENPSLIFAGAGQLAMANAGSSNFRGTNGSEFFISQTNGTRFLDFNYTIFGQLLTGYDTMNKVMAVQTGTDGETPTAPVVIDSVSVSEDNTDAIMLVSAAGSVPNGATIHVTAKDGTPQHNVAVTPNATGTGTTQGLALPMATFDDTTNDPPIILPDANVFAALHQRVTLPIRGEDLEFDFLSPSAEIISGSTATVSVSGKVATVTPNPSSPIGGDDVGLTVSEPFTTNDPSAETAVTVGLGSGKLTGSPVFLTATTGGALFSSTSDGVTNPATVFGSFISSRPTDVAGDFTATINWADGVVTTSTATTISGTDGLVSGTGEVSVVVKAPNRPTTFNVTAAAGHSYAGPGIYPVNVTVSDTNGGVLEIQNTAVVSDSNIYALGRNFTAVKGSFNGQVATFIDRTTAFTANTYSASINWGDGAVTAGTITGGNGSFQVYGKHKYTQGTTYPVDVTIGSLADSTHRSGYAWSNATLTGVATRQPPFAQSHIIGELGNPGFGNGVAFIDEEVTLFNSGNLASGPVTLRFYLSGNSNATVSGDTLLPIGKGFTYTTVSIAAGQAISGSVSDIALPTGGARGKFLKVQVITSDPIANHMDYPRIFVDPNPLID
jgi:uncharacterized repeat protein (TIGR03803 family)